MSLCVKLRRCVVLRFVGYMYTRRRAGGRLSVSPPAAACRVRCGLPHESGFGSLYCGDVERRCGPPPDRDAREISAARRARRVGCPLTVPLDSRDPELAAALQLLYRADAVLARAADIHHRAQGAQCLAHDGALTTDPAETVPGGLQMSALVTSTSYFNVVSVSHSPSADVPSRSPSHRQSTVSPIPPARSMARSMAARRLWLFASAAGPALPPARTGMQRGNREGGGRHRCHGALKRLHERGGHL